MKRKILIVDDEPGFTKIVKMTLEASGAYEVRELNDPSVALAVARQFSPDLIRWISPCRNSMEGM